MLAEIGEASMFPFERRIAPSSLSKIAPVVQVSRRRVRSKQAQPALLALPPPPEDGLQDGAAMIESQSHDCSRMPSERLQIIE